MQYKTLSAILFASAALAAPAPESTSTADLSGYDNYDDSGYGGLDYTDIPTSVLQILATAVVPTTWVESMYSNTAFVDAEASRIADGDFPAWVTSLPESAQTYVEEELQAQASAYESYYGAVSSDASSTVTGGSSSAEATKTGSTTESNAASSSGSASTSGSASASASGASSTSTGGAPAATGGIAMSVAGAAGVLGLALAL